MNVAVAVRKIGMMFLVVLISLALGELALRLVDAIRPSYVFHDDTYNRFRVRPGSKFYGFPVNSLGFLDTEFSTKSSGSFRIVALGDSFAFGVVPYESNYLTLLEERLDELSPLVEVLNMGIPRTSPNDYLNLLINEGFDLDPDLVLVSLYIGNDLIETQTDQKPGPAASFVDRSYVASLVRHALRLQRATEWGAAHRRRSYSDDAPTFSEATYLQILANRAQIYVVGWDGLVSSVRSIRGAFERMANLCRRRGIPLAVVLIPEEIQVDPELQAAVAASQQRLQVRAMDYTQPNRALSRELQDLGIPFLDLRPAFDQASRSEHLYKPRDTHWNIAGNRLAAVEIAAFLVKHGLVPPPTVGTSH